MSYIVFSSQDIIYNMSLSKATKYLYVKQIKINIKMDGQKVLKKKCICCKITFSSVSLYEFPKINIIVNINGHEGC